MEGEGRKPEEVMKKMAATQILGSSRALARYFQLRDEKTDVEKAMRMVSEGMKRNNVNGDNAEAMITFSKGMNEGIRSRQPIQAPEAARAGERKGATRSTETTGQPEPTSQTNNQGRPRPVFSEQTKDEDWGLKTIGGGWWSRAVKLNASEVGPEAALMLSFFEQKLQGSRGGVPYIRHGKCPTTWLLQHVQRGLL